jgi:hypothetical protein
LYRVFFRFYSIMGGAVFLLDLGIMVLRTLLDGV